MIIFLKFTPEFDLYFLSENRPEEFIKINLENGSHFFINAIQASLMNNRKVIIADEKFDISTVKLEKLNSHHFFKSNNFLFLNISLKNKLDKLKDKPVIYTKFQEIEEHLTELIKL